MKKKSTSQSAFLNLRVLLGLSIVLAGVFLALIGLGTFSGLTANSAKAQQTHKIINIKGLPPGFDCATIHEKGINRMEGFRAGLIMIACGESPGGLASPYSAFSRLFRTVTAPLTYGGTDVDLVTGTETSPHIIQSETYSTANPDNPDEICVAFNDSRGAAVNQFSGVSCSTDGGVTFTRVTTSGGQGPFANTFGDPVILYNRPTQMWFTVWLDGNGSCTLGGYKSSTPEDPTSWSHFCVHTSGGDDRESGWADNNPSSPNFGNMYVSWNDFNVGGGGLQVSRSTDNGATWSPEIHVTTTFIRDVQITGDASGNGTIYIAGMDEGGGGFPHNDTNKIFRSTDGGNTWTNTYTGSPFAGPGVQVCNDNPYFSCMFSDQGGFWRHEGWGEPAALNNVVHLVYAQHGAGSDPGDVFYIRSTDSGVTFGAPFKLNTDSTTRPQWQPNISVSPSGTLFAMWYDARESTSCTKGNPSVPCYRMWGRKSTDNGATWLPDMEFSDVVTPLPGQSDPFIVTGYAGDYDYGSAVSTTHVTSWDDGRVPISGASQQDTFFDQEPAGPPGSPTPTATASPTPTATATPPNCSWGSGPDLPSTDTRSVGVFFPANGKFYVMGGRDLNNVEVTNPFEYNPVSNNWTTKSAAYPDAFTNNMACGVLNDSGTDYIYCAGGSNFATQTTSGRVFRYDPIADSLTTVSSNYPPGDNGTLPGGFTVFNNTLITVGGFDIPNGVGTDQIWQFTPSPAGWVQKIAVLPVPLGYLPTTTIGSLIYTGGGADITGGVLTDTNNAFVYDPVADSINTIAPIPDATSNTRAVNFCNLMYVLGGNFNAPTNEVQIYDPASNTWSVGIPFAIAGRNFAADTDGTNNIWKAGGYDASLNIIASMEIFNCPVSPCGLASPTPTASPSATPTATATPTGSPSCTPIVIDGSIATGDPSHTDKLAESGIPQTCAGNETCSIFGDPNSFRYDSYSFTNTGGAACVTIDTNTGCNADHAIFTSAYLGSFDPNNLCTNWAGDVGTDPNPEGSFQVNVPGGQTLIVVVNEEHHAGCPGYELTITGLCPTGISPTPTATASPSCTPGGTTGPWAIVANYPLISESVSCSSDGTFGYCVGGFDSSIGGPTNQFNQYDPVANTWTALPSIPGAFYDAPSVYAANTNSIYVFGGIDSTFTPSSVLQIYDVSAGTWSTGAPMPGPRYFASAAYYSANGKIYVISGFDQNFLETSTTWEYDPVANTWDTTRANMPVPTGGAGYSIVGQNIYLAGTWNGGNGSNQNYRYDIVADTWTAIAPVPVNIYRPDSGAIGTNCYLVGGGNPFVGGRFKAFKGPKVLHPSTNSPETSYNSTYIYDTIGDTWSTGPNTNVAHSFTGGTAIGNTLIVVTGFDGVTGDTNVVESSVAAGCVSPTPTATATAAVSATPTATATPTGSPSCTPIVIDGSIATGDPSHTDKLAQSGIPQTCAGIETCSIFGDPNSFRYDSYSFTNTGGAACVTIDTNTGCNADHAIFTSAYLGSFDPNNLCTNWAGDVGTDPNPEGSFQVNVPGGQTLIVVVNEEHHAGCPGYELTITGLCPGTPSPTPSGTPSCTPGGGTPGPWTQAAPVAVDHYGGFMDSDGTFGYEGGGYSFSVGDNINNFAKFNPGANTWTALAVVPDLNNGEASAVYAPNVNKLFVFGGEEVTFALVVNTTRIYDIATDTWSTGAPMPDIRAFMASGYFNGKIYLVGGYNSGNVDPSFGQVWEYDPVTNTFDTSRTDMPATLGGPGFGVINGHLYVAGGRDINNTNLSTLYDYDIATDTWTQRANLPTGINVPGSAVIGGKLWVFGGGDPFRGSSAVPRKKQAELPETTNILQVYDPVTDSWTVGPSLNLIRSFPAGTDVGSTAVAVGGFDGGNTITSVEINVTSGGNCSPTPTATATSTTTPVISPTATSTATATATSTAPPPTATATATATSTAVASATPTATATATHTPRPTPTPRPAPTPVERTGNCFFFNSTCSGLPQLVNMTCIDCIVSHPGASWEDGSGCLTTCPMR